jgi:Sulfotransferase domain
VSEHVTLAMWSGPRNISTAMMYAFGNRPDCFAWDEPFYGFELATSGRNHPMRADIIAANETDWEVLVAKCLAPPPVGKHLFYQKHMTHHMLAGFDRTWIKGLTNAFLIRSPERVLASYAKKWSGVSLGAIGFVEQAELFDLVCDHLGRAPPVIDADDVLSRPREVLGKLCEACGIAFMEEMLGWPKGPKPFDGVWARHWYNAVWQSRGFDEPPPRAPKLPASLEAIAEKARPYYDRLSRFRLR